MNPASLVPTPDAIPVPWGWFYILLMVTFLLHLLAMSAMLGGGIIAFLTSLRSKDEPLIAREISYKWPYTIAFAVNMGVAPLLFIQVLYGQFIYSSSVLMAVFWLSIVGLLILAYYSAYMYDFRFDRLGPSRIYFLGFSVLIMLVIAFFFTNNMTLMMQPERWAAYFENRQGTILNLSDPILLPRYLHFVVGSVAVAGLFLVVISRFNFIKTEVDKKFLVTQGLKYYTHATLIQILIGIWFLFSLPNRITTLFMGGSAYGTLLLCVGVLLVLFALFSAFKARPTQAIAATFLLLVVMILIRDLVRTAYLSPYFSLSELTVDTQYSPLIFFLVVFLLGLGLLAYMIKLAVRCKREVMK